MFPHREQSVIRVSFGPATSAQKQRFEHWSEQNKGKGLEGKGHGSVKGPITVSVGPIRRSGSHPRRLVSTSYALRISCHGRGRGFEPRRPRHSFQSTYGTFGNRVTLKSGHNLGTCLRTSPDYAVLRRFSTPFVPRFPIII